MHKPTVLYLVTEDWYFQNHRLDHARALIQDGFEVHVACRESDRRLAIEDAGVRFHPLELQRGASAGYVSESRLLHRVIRTVRPDIVHAVALKPVMLSLSLLPLHRKLSFVLAVSGIGVASVETGAAFRASIKVLNAVSRLKRCTLLVQNSSDRRLVDPGSRHSVLIPGVGVDTERFYSEPLSLKADQILRLIFLGRPVRSKGLLDLVHALPKVNESTRVEADLFLTTDDLSPGSLSADEMRQLEESPYINVHGPSGDPANDLRASDLAILPSRGGEGVSKFSLEALAVGRPLIASNTAGNSEVVEHGVNGFLFEPGDVASLTSTLLDVASAVDTLPEMGRRASEHAEKSYSLDVIAPQIIELHRGLL